MEIIYNLPDNDGCKREELEEHLAECIAVMEPDKLAGLLGTMLARMVECHHVDLYDALGWVDSDASNVETLP